MTAERYRHLFPRFHVRPATGFVNDPNGPLLVDGELHLFFQHRFEASGAGPVSWGHATSRDFVTWRYHRPAIAPQRDGPDRDGCWSGSTVLDGGDILAFYSGFVTGAPYQPVIVARSRNGGLDFGDGRIVAAPKPGDGLAHFRDPFVWREGDGWRMLVGAGGGNEVASARLYESPDLAVWSDRGAYLALARRTADGLDTGAMWECPQLARLGGTDVLIVSPWAPGEELKPVLAISAPAGEATVSRLDQGSSFYAASVLRESVFGPLVWGWATEARTNDWCAETDWAGMLTLPRRIELAEDGSVRSRPPGALTQLRRRALHVMGTRAGTATVAEVPPQFELELTLAARKRTAPLRIRLELGPGEGLECAVDLETCEISLDTTAASVDPRAFGNFARFVDPALGSAATATVSLFVDGSIVELFSSGGRCATTRMYPTAKPPWSLQIEGLGELDGLACWELRAAVGPGD